MGRSSPEAVQQDRVGWFHKQFGDDLVAPRGQPFTAATDLESTKIRSRTGPLMAVEAMSKTAESLFLRVHQYTNGAMK